MILAILFTIGLGTTILWWMAAELSGPARAISGITILLAVAAAITATRHRWRRIRSSREGVSPQIMSHDGHFGMRKRRDGSDEPETFFGGHW